MANTEGPSPLLLFVLLAIAVIFCSSAGVCFALMGTTVPPFLRASWRLWMQELFQLIPFIVEYRKSTIDKSKYRQTLPLLMFSGVLLGMHFSSWVWSIDNTSLTHALCWISMYPICLNVGAWLLYFYVVKFSVRGLELCCCGYGIGDLGKDNVAKPSTLETVGTAIGLCGALLMLLDAGEGDNEVTVVGDLAAFFGAATMAGYLVIGQVLRKWLSIWLYAFPVCGAAILASLAFSFASEDVTFLGFDDTSVFGFLTVRQLPYSLYLGACCGVAGHTLLNYLLGYMSPLVIASSLLLEPLVGSFIGWLVGVGSLPGLFTWLGGCVLMGGLLAVVWGENVEREKQKKILDLRVNEEEENNKNSSL